MNLTKSEKHVLLHTTGLDRSKDAYRNHFVCGENHTDFKTLESLVGKSLMDKMRDNLDETNVTFVYRCTEKGIEAAKEIAPTDLIIISDSATSIREHFEDEDEETGVITLKIEHAAQRMWAKIQKLENENETLADSLVRTELIAVTRLAKIEELEKKVAKMKVKPKPEDYGFHQQSGFDDEPCGWCLPEGEEEYEKALKAWEETQK